VFNRATITHAIERAIAGAKAQSHFALLFIDLDKFKHINDTLGHAAGDYVLQEAANRLRRVVSDGSILGRLGGDEFIVLQTDFTTFSTASALSDAIRTAFNSPFTLSDGSAAFVGVSIGIACFPDDGHDMGSVLGAADTSLYRAKRSRGPELAA
jgi:diguanylate cyclase (GGDEF)-like protein